MVVILRAMIRGLGSQAYTIVEVLIVLGVTGALLIAVMTTFAGQQNRTEFGQSINDIDAKIRDVITNINNGYYTNTGNFYCDALTGDGPHLHPGASQQGQNVGCEFIGRAMQFAADNNASTYNIYSIVGQRVKNNQDVTSLTDAVPTAIAPPNGADATDSNSLLYGLKAAKMYFTQGGVRTPVNTVAFMSTLPGYSGGNLNAGNQSVELRPVQNTADISNPASDKSAATAVSLITAGNLSLIPDAGVTICFQSGGTNQYGVITIGSNNRQLTTKVQIEDSAVATASGGDCA